MLLKLFGYQVRSEANNGGYVQPDNFLKNQFDTRVKEMLNPDSRIQQIFKDANILDTFNQHPSQLPQQAKDSILNTAETVNDVAQTITTDEGVDLSVNTDKDSFKETNLPSYNTTTPALSTFATTALAAFKAIPGKAFLAGFLPFMFFKYMKEDKLTNININLKSSERQLIVIKLGSDAAERRVALICAPNEKLYSVKEYSTEAPSTGKLLPSITQSTSFIWNNVISPLALWMPKRVNDHRVYNLKIEDQNFNPHLVNGPTTIDLQLSSDEVLRLTHTMSDAVYQAFKLSYKTNENIEIESADSKDKIVNIDITESNFSTKEIARIPLSHFLNNSNEYVTIIKKNLPIPSL